MYLSKFACLSSLLLAATVTANESTAFTNFEFKAIGTTIRITYPVRDLKLESQIRSFFEELEAQASLYRSDSSLSLINKSKAGKRVEVSSVLCNLLTEGIRLTEKTDGRFDITYKNHSVKTIGVDCANDRKKYFIWRKQSGTLIDLNAIAAGFAADRVGEFLKSSGINDFLIDAGGEILACGQKAGKPWTVAIEDPKSTDRFLKKIQFKDNGCHAVSTSGDYRRYIVKDGKRVSFITNPKSGKSVTNARLVTVIAKTATEADALSTAISVAVNDHQYIEKLKKRFGLKIYTVTGDKFVFKEFE